MMTSKTYTIYSAINPHVTKEVTARKRKEYLKCKFWKVSKQEAWSFFYCYFPPSATPSLCRLLLVLSGRLFKAKEFDKAIAKAWELNEQKLFRQVNADSVDDPKYKKIIEAFDDSYPRDGLLDDILLWAKDKKLITNAQVTSLSKKIGSIRDSILNHEDISEAVLLDTLNLLVENNLSTPILYHDAQKLLFPNNNLLDDLMDKAYHLSTSDYFYFGTRSLMKWLMQQGYLSEQLTENFRSIKVETVKQSMVTYNGRFSSLQKLIKQGADRDDLLYEALQGEPLYWKYPPDCKCKKNIDNHCICNNGVRWGEIKPWVKYDTTATQRLNGFGELKKNELDDTFLCRFGGLTINMLRHDKLPQTTTNHYKIELVPTKEEIVSDLQPYIIISQNELLAAIADDKIGFLDKPSSRQASTTDNKKKGKKKRVHKLKLLIQKIYQTSDDKDAESIWKKIKVGDYIWIDSIDPWSDMRDGAKITWCTANKSETPFSRGAFENYVSNLTTGKEPFSESSYDDLYED